MIRTLALAAGAFVLLATPAPASSAPPCSMPQYRQFDFWLGNWTVTSHRTGKFAGSNNVTREYGGCVVMEHWSGARGGHGSSFNTYDAGRHLWHQTWVDDSGSLLLLDGGLRNGSMVLQGTNVDGNGKPVLNRITWTPMRNGSVRQHWVVSTDGGKTWSDAFDGIYTRKPSSS
jgi:hypothetical protein